MVDGIHSSHARPSTVVSLLHSICCGCVVQPVVQQVTLFRLAELFVRLRYGVRVSASRVRVTFEGRCPGHLSYIGGAWFDQGV